MLRKKVCPCPAPRGSSGLSEGPELWVRIQFTYGVSVQQALEVIEGTDGVVTQHLVELLGNGVSLPGKDGGPSELRARAFQPWPSSP